MENNINNSTSCNRITISGVIFAKKKMILGLFLLWSLSLKAGTELISPPPPFVQSKESEKIIKNAKITFNRGEFCSGQHVMRFSESQTPFLSWKEKKQVDFYFWVKSGTKWIGEFKKFETEMIPESKTIIGKSIFPVDIEDKNSSNGSYIQKARLINGNRIEMEFSYKCPIEFAEKFKKFIPTLFIPRSMAAGRIMKVDGEEVTLPIEKEWDSGLNENHRALVGSWSKVKKLEFAPERSEGFTLEFSEPLSIRMARDNNQKQNQLWIYLGSFRQPEGTLKMSMSLNESGDDETKNDSIAAGINFTQCDNLNVPVYKNSANLLMNPSFNSGFRYYKNGEYSGPRFINKDKTIVDCDAPFGTRAMLLSEGKSLETDGIKSFGIPIYADTPYVLSFYAKPLENKASIVDVRLISYDRKDNGTSFKSFRIVPNKWTRCILPFSHSKRQVWFSVRQKNKDDNILVGGFQLEKGGEVTEYCGNPFGMEIMTDSPDGMVCDAEKPINAKLIVRGPAGAKGRVEVQGMDFYYRKFYNKDFVFNLGGNGQDEIALPLNSIIPLGPSVISAKLKPERGKGYIDYFRLTRMKYVGNKFKNNRIHTTGEYAFTGLKVPNSELDFYRKCGFSKALYLRPIKDPDRQYFELFNKYGIDLISVGAYEFFLKQNRNRYDFSKRIDYSLDLNFIKATPEFQIQTEQAYCSLAKQFPFSQSWIVGKSEPDSLRSIQEEKYDEFAKFQIATARGIKRGNPEAKIISGGSCNMAPRGREMTLNILAACKKLAPDLKFDGVEIHTYRPFPEQPDTEDDLVAFFKGLKKLGYGDDFPVYLNEGAYFYPLNVPVWMGIAPWSSTTSSKDKYSNQNYPSYDMGWAARLSPAMTMRYWLVCYKYANRIKSATPWGPMFLDCRTPHAIMPMSSALAEILGNAIFKYDIRFAPRARAYVFEDEKKCPVAAVWYFSEDVERGREIPPRMIASFKNTPEFLDMFGNICETPIKNGKYNLPLSNFPFFIRGKAGEMDEICQGLREAKLGGANYIPFNMILKPVEKNKAVINISNLLSEPFKGTLSINREKAVKLDLAPRGNSKLPFDKKGLIPDNKIGNISLPIIITPEDSNTIEKDLTMQAFAANYVEAGKIRIDAQDSDWNDIPSITMTNYLPASPKYPLDKKEAAKTFSASYKVAWNYKAVYMLININDSDFAVDHRKADPATWWAKSSVQFFWDIMGDAREKEANNVLGYDENDYSYELLPNESGKSAVVYRRVAPDTQLTGGVHDCLLPGVLEPGVKVAFRNNGGKQIYEVKFPARYVQPLQLIRGVSSALGIFIFDHTGKIIITNGPEGKSFYKNPHNCPYMLFSDERIK
ncbi:MAG: hypothetical protein JXR78_06480 [Victivallales bacterium]|nr:hypothetical protein [Victivallales bacterium]